jgi:hypothetical protein
LLAIADVERIANGRRSSLLAPGFEVAPWLTCSVDSEDLALMMPLLSGGGGLGTEGGAVVVVEEEGFVEDGARCRDSFGEDGLVVLLER